MQTVSFLEDLTELYQSLCTEGINIMLVTVHHSLFHCMAVYDQRLPQSHALGPDHCISSSSYKQIGPDY